MTEHIIRTAPIDYEPVTPPPKKPDYVAHVVAFAAILVVLMVITS